MNKPWAQYVAPSEPPKEQAELIEVVPQRFEDLPARTRGLQRSLSLSRPITPTSTHSNLAQLEAGPDAHPEAELEVEREAKPRLELSEKNVVVAGRASHDDALSPPAASPAGSTSGTTAVSHPASSEVDTFSVTFPPKALPKKRPSSADDPPRPSNATGPSFMRFEDPPEDYTPNPPRPKVERVPPRVPILTDEYRYDYRVGFLRPYRSHRCRHCAAVVLKQDHHWCVPLLVYKASYLSHR